MALRPLTNTDHKPYNPKINYDSSNDKTDPVTDQGYNIACFNHDCRYSDPTEGGEYDPPLTRAEVDRMFLRDMKAAGVSLMKRTYTYLAVRAGGGTSWANARANDKEQGK